MDMDCVLTVVYVGKQLWDSFIIVRDGESRSIVSTDECSKVPTIEQNSACGDMLWPESLDRSPFSNKLSPSKNGDEEQLFKHTALKASVKMNGHALSYFVKLLKFLPTYRKLVINHLKCRKLGVKNLSCRHSSVVLKIHLIDVDQQIIDVIWNKHISYLVVEQCELGHAMSWLSTLGGAFSALGDYYIHCAEIAGHISLKQWSIALRLGDPNTVARCHLFSALSLMQTGRLREARHIVWNQYHTLKSGKYGPEPETRLLRMCQGVWAKLRYEYQQRSQRRRSPKAFHWRRHYSIKAA